MPILVAHQDDCAISQAGPVQSVQFDEHSTSNHPRICTCGGIKIRLGDLLLRGDNRAKWLSMVSNATPWPPDSDLKAKGE